MEEFSGEVDWHNLPTELRYTYGKQLYSVISVVAPKIGKKIESYAIEILGPHANVADTYHSTMRKGKMSVQHTLAVHNYLAENHFEDAHHIAPHLFPDNPTSKWARFLQEHQREGSLKLVRLADDFGIVRRTNDLPEVSDTLKLGEKFCFSLISVRPGHLVAFQGYRGGWHHVPLDRDGKSTSVSIHEGQQYLPANAKGIAIPLTEEDDAGRHTFVAITSSQRDLTRNHSDLANRLGDPDLQVFRVEVRFVT